MVFGTLKKEDKSKQAARLANHLALECAPVRDFHEEIERKSVNLRCFHLTELLEKAKHEFYETKSKSIENLSAIVEKYLRTLKQLRGLDKSVRPTLSEESLNTATVEAEFVKSRLKDNGMLIRKLGETSFILNFYQLIDTDLYEVVNTVFD